MALLIVEDEPLVLLGLAEDLQSRGFEVIACASADAALPLLASNSAIEAVVTDVRMPGTIDGVGLARHIREHYPRLPVVIVSGEQTARHVPSIAHARFVKPVSIDVLVETIKRLTA